MTIQDRMQRQQHSSRRSEQSVAGPLGGGAGLNAHQHAADPSKSRAFASPAATSPSTWTPVPLPPRPSAHDDASLAQSAQHTGGRPSIASLDAVDAASDRRSHPARNASSISENAAKAGPKPVFKMKRTGQNLPLSSAPYLRTKSDSPRQSLALASLERAYRTISESPMAGKPVSAIADLRPNSQASARAVSSDVPRPVVGDVKRGDPRSASSRPASSVPVLSTASAEAPSDAESGDDSDGAIKYEKNGHAGFEDVFENGASDRDSSDDESAASGSDREDVAEEPELQNDAWQQVFQPPDLKSGSDNEEEGDNSQDEDDASTSDESSSSDSAPDQQSSTTTAPTSRVLGQVTYPTTILFQANLQRPYTEIEDNGQHIKASPAIFPDGYRKCAESEIPGHPWMCAIRSCRRSFVTVAGLSNHMRFKHKRTMLNDNMDGTLSIIGTYTQQNSQKRNPPVVVSKRPLDPTEPPMAEPSVPKGKNLRITPLEHTEPVQQANPDETRHSTRQRFPPPRFTDLPQSIGNPPFNKPPRVTSAPTSDQPFRLFEPSEITPLEYATEDRKYKTIQDLRGELVTTCGALLPRNYTIDNTYPGFRWICPIRTCRRVFASLIALGSHFCSKMHRGMLLNDNSDGTLSQVGYYETPLPGMTACLAVVISQKPLDPSEAEPLEEPRRPPQYTDNHKKTLSIPHKPSAIYTTSHEKQTTVKTNEANTSSFWSYLLPYLPESYASISPDSEILGLLDLPRKRTTLWRENQIKRRLDNDELQVIGLIVHLAGTLREDSATDSRQRSCTNCVDGLGPFQGCYSLPNDVSRLVYNCCANCLFEHAKDTCVTKDSERTTVAGPTNDDSAVSPRDLTQESATHQRKRRHSDPEADDRGSAIAPRRSGRLQISDDTAATVEPRRKMAKTSVGSGQNGTGSGGSIGHVVNSKDTHPSLSAASSSIVLHAGQVESTHFEMEDWEIAPGHIREAGVGQPNNIAFSKPYLERHQAIQISPDLLFRVETIKSGYTSEIELDPKNTRYCSVASGKVRVMIEGQPDLTIGSHGLFKIMPAKKVRVQNRLYFDAVLHISTFASW